MNFQYSDVVDPSTYVTDGLCDGIPLRIHKDAMSEIKGAVRCQKDWSEHVNPVANYKGTLGTPFSLIRVAIPESLPERLEIVSYANEFAFIYDDVIMEDVEQSLSQDRGKILKEFIHDISHEEAPKTTSKLHGVKQIQIQIFAEMLAMDQKRAETTISSWKQFVDIVSNRKRSETFNGLEEYLPCRISDAGELFWFGLLTFAMGLTIPEEETELWKKHGRPAWEALALTNDLYSWEKERDDAARANQPQVVNAIWILMQKYSVTEAEAKKLCTNKIKESVAKAVRIVEQTRHDTNLSLDLRRYIEAMMYTISGNLVWSIYCPRYHPEKTYGELELAKMAEVMMHCPSAGTGLSVR